MTTVLSAVLSSDALVDFLTNFMDLANTIESFDDLMAKMICKQIVDMFRLINSMLKSTLQKISSIVPIMHQYNIL